MPSSSTTDALETALALHRRGAIAEAAAIYTQVQRADPRNADAPYYLATIACQQGQFAQGATLVRIPAIVTIRSDGSRPPVPIDRDQFDGAVRCIF